MKHRFASSCLVFARSRTRRDRRAGRLSALAGGGPARIRHGRPRKSRAIVAAPVPPRSGPISFAGLARVSRRSRTRRRRVAAASPYRNVRLAAPVLWQPLISASRGRRRSAFRDRRFESALFLHRSITPSLTSSTIFRRPRRRGVAAQQEDLPAQTVKSALVQPRTSRRWAEECLDRPVKTRVRPGPRNG